jgi:aspartate kinase
MVGKLDEYEKILLDTFRRFRATVVSKDINANTVTHYLGCNLKTVKRIIKVIKEKLAGSEVDHRKVSMVSAIGSDMQVPGVLAKAVSALADNRISILAMHQSMRQVDMQFIIDESDYNSAVISLHQRLVEPHDYGEAICAV